MEQYGLLGWTSVTVVSLCSEPGNSCNDAVGRYLADAIVIGVCDENIASGVGYYAMGIAELSGYGWTAVAGKTCRATSSDCCYHAVGRNLAKRAVRALHRCKPTPRLDRRTAA